MCPENVISFQLFAENHRKRRLSKDTVPTAMTFSPDWKSACLEILKVFQEVERQRLKRSKFRWMATRDVIMRKFDDASGNKILARDRRLTYDHLVDWDRHGTIPDTAFRFVDHFVRSLAMTREYKDVLLKAQHVKERQNAIALSNLYQVSNAKEEVTAYIFEISKDYLYTYDVAEATYDGIVLRFDFFTEGVIKFTVAYFRTPNSLEGPQSIDDTLFYDGYMFVVPFSTDPNKEFKPYEIASWNCWVKLSQQHQKGSWHSGCADGLISYSVLDHRRDSLTIDIHIDFPNSVLTPRSSKDCLDDRFIPGVQNGKPQNLAKPNLYKANDLSEKFDRIFEKYYSGYLF
ncbi:MAG: hypothetical protein AB3N23_01865 [Paracoccaceae bacterium]